MTAQFSLTARLPTAAPIAGMRPITGVGSVVPTTSTAKPEGTFAAILPRLPDLKDLGVNAIEIMPVAQFPGDRNWGYDGVFPFATQNSYGGPDDLKRLVDACHAEGLAVILDVVYNYLGPEGNYLADFGPYFTDKYKTPWGPAINFDDAFSDDDFHHSLHALLTGERQGYYLDFRKTRHLADAFRQGFVYSGDYSLFRKRRHGNSPKSRPGRQFVVAAQNHDQVGNRMLGERLSQLVDFEALKTAAAAVILSPFIPLLFMGEEYGEKTLFYTLCITLIRTWFLRCARAERRNLPPLPGKGSALTPKARIPSIGQK